MLPPPQSVLSPLAFFDIFEYPLTLPELRQFLWKYHEKISLEELSRCVENFVQSHIIESRNGFFFLPGRGDTIASRERAVREIEKKMRIAERACAILRWIPFLQAVFVCNTVAGGYAKPDSDIDIFIVTRRGRIFLTRLLTTFTLSIFRLRRNRVRVTDRICLSFYVTHDALALKPIAIPGEDVYLAYWLCQLVPVYDPEHTLKKIRETNPWVATSLPYGFSTVVIQSDRRVSDSKFSSATKKLFEKLWQGRYGGLLESQAKAFETTHMKLRSIRQTESASRHIVVSDTMLKFHENDRRKEFQERWRKTLEENRK